MKMEQILRLQALNKPVEEIAGMMGLSPATISDLISTGDYERMRTTYCERLYLPVDEAIQKRNTSALLEDASPDAAEALIALLIDGDPIRRHHASTAILDRSGHGPIQRRAVRHRIELDPASASLITAAMRESEIDDAIVLEADPIEEIPGRTPTKEGLSLPHQGEGRTIPTHQRRQGLVEGGSTGSGGGDSSGGGEERRDEHGLDVVQDSPLDELPAGSGGISPLLSSDEGV